MTPKPRFEIDPEDKASLESCDIPAATLGGLLRYIEHGIPPGHFLTAVLSNDLFGAVSHADGTNLAALPTIVKAIYNYCPAICHGSRDAVKDWITNLIDGE